MCLKPSQSMPMAVKRDSSLIEPFFKRIFSMEAAINTANNLSDFETCLTMADYFLGGTWLKRI